MLLLCLVGENIIIQPAFHRLEGQEWEKPMRLKQDANKMSTRAIKMGRWDASMRSHGGAKRKQAQVDPPEPKQGRVEMKVQPASLPTPPSPIRGRERGEQQR